MTNTAKKLFYLISALFLMSVPMFAQGATAAGDTGGKSWMGVGAALGMGLGSGLCALAQGKAVAGAAEGIARNPGASAAIRLIAILGLAFIESLALYVFVIIFLFK